MTQAKRRLTDINFDFEGAHVALVGTHQGGPANGVTTLITKATNALNPEEVLNALSEDNQHNLEVNDMDQIEKSVHETLLADAVAVEKAAGAAAIAVIQKALDEQAEVLKSVQEELEVFKAAAAQAKVEARKAALVDAKVAGDKVEGVLKSLEALEDEAFATVVETMKAAAAAVDASDMMVEQGVQGAGAENQGEVDRTTAILKAKYEKAGK